MMEKTQIDIEETIRKSKHYIDSGQFESAVKELGHYWKGIGITPELKEVSAPLKYRLILLCGMLTGWLGSSRQIEGAQEKAKDIISQASDGFESCGDIDRWAESRGELALCYWREGSFSEARIILQNAVERVSDDAFEIKSLLLLRLVNVEISTYNYETANQLLIQTAGLLENVSSDLLCGKVFFHHALVMRRLAKEVNRGEYLEESFGYYKKAEDYYHKAGHNLYTAMVANNLGYLLCEMKRFEEAHEHIEKAFDYFREIGDEARTSLVLDNKAQVLLAEGKYEEAERNALEAVSIIKQGDEQSSLAEYLTTLGKIYSAQSDYDNARNSLLEAAEIACQVGDNENCGLAFLTLIDNFYDSADKDELLEYYMRADEVLSRTKQKAILNRLNHTAKLLLKSDVSTNESTLIEREQFVGKSAIVKDLLATAKLYAEDITHVLITGESGVGKETLARQIHQWSELKGEFISVSCSVFAEKNNLPAICSEIFGKSGNFSATQKNTGDGGFAGTLYLRDIEFLSMAEQSALGDYLENNPVFQINSRRKLKLIVSSNAALEDLVEQKLFRQDLYFHLKTFAINIPSLRQRREDISIIADHIVEHLTLPKKVKLDVGFYSTIKKLELFGNGDELRSIIENYLWCKYRYVKFEYFAQTEDLRSFEPRTSSEWKNFSMPEELNRYKAEIISNALESADGKITEAAKYLGITHQNLSVMLKKHHSELTDGLKKRKRRTAKKS